MTCAVTDLRRLAAAHDITVARLRAGSCASWQRGWQTLADALDLHRDGVHSSAGLAHLYAERRPQLRAGALDLTRTEQQTLRRGRALVGAWTGMPAALADLRLLDDRCVPLRGLPALAGCHAFSLACDEALRDVAYLDAAAVRERRHADRTGVALVQLLLHEQLHALVARRARRHGPDSTCDLSWRLEEAAVCAIEALAAYALHTGAQPTVAQTRVWIAQAAWDTPGDRLLAVLDSAATADQAARALFAAAASCQPAATDAQAARAITAALGRRCDWQTVV